MDEPMKQTLILVAMATFLTFTSCRSTKGLERPLTPTEKPSASTTGVKGTQAVETYVTRVTGNAVSQQCITAKVKVEFQGAGKDLSVNGQLRMKRDDVVQLSLTFLGMEVGRLEFTPQDVLIVDRMNKQYVRAAYSEVSFLKSANLDFYSLQALFWNELFIPGERAVKNHVSRFQLKENGTTTLLSLTDTPRLNYTFTTQARDARIERMDASGRNASDKGTFTFSYSDFTSFAGRTFPSGMKMQVTGAGKDMGLALHLSRLGNDSDWQQRTTVSSKYTRRSVDEVLGRLLKQ